MISRKITRNFRTSILWRAMSILSRKSKIKILIVSILQVLVSLLDLVGVALIGILGALTVTGVQSRAPGNRVMQILEFLGIENFTLQNQAAMLGSFATALFVARTFLTILFTRRTIHFLSRQGSILGSEIVRRILSRPITYLQSKSPQDLVYLTTIGANSVSLGVIGNFVTLVSDVSLLIVLSIGLFILDPLIAIETIGIFAVIAFILNGLLQKKAKRLSEDQYRYTVLGNEQLLESFSSYREILVRNRRDYYAEQNAGIRNSLAGIHAETTFMPNISKYAIEITVIFGAFLFTGLQFFLQDAANAIATLSVFLAAGSRIAPAVLRVQQGAIQIQSSIGSALPTLELLAELSDVDHLPLSSNTIDLSHNGFENNIVFNAVSLKYPAKEDYALNEINLRIKPGSLVAVVGPSGAGKTSLVDVLLGVISPTSGSVLIGGERPLKCIEKWPGALSYVPQDVMISNTTVAANVALGFSSKMYDASLVNEALEVAQLSEFVSTLKDGINTEVGERGAQLSGGQRQRLGIARAMFTKPKLLVLDEATSALDGETEMLVSKAINSLKGSVTIILVAHRLSTVRDADLVLYMEEGKLLAHGSLSEVREAVPNFDRQAKLMGL